MDTLNTSQNSQENKKEIINEKAEELLIEADNYLAILRFNAFHTKHHIDSLYLRLAYEHRIVDKYLTQAVINLCSNDYVADYFWERIPEYNSWLKRIISQDSTENIDEKALKAFDKKAKALKRKEKYFEKRAEDAENTLNNKLSKVEYLKGEIEKKAEKLEKMGEQLHIIRDLRSEASKSNEIANILRRRYGVIVKNAEEVAMNSFGFASKNGRKQFFKVLRALKMKPSQEILAWVKEHYDEDVVNTYIKASETYIESYSKNGFEEYDEDLDINGEND